MKRAASFHEDRYIMEPRDNTRRDKQRRDSVDESEREWEHHIRTPLSVIYGRVQLMQRRIHKGEVLDQEDLIRTLSTIEQATRAITARLRAHRNTTRVA
jgi:signal transduction histidine kinase